MPQDRQVPRKKSDHQLLILWGILIHVMVLIAINDLFFSNRKYEGLKAVEPSTDTPPAKRLVLFLADGLGYDAVFEPDPFNQLFLFNITREEGSWGLVQSRFPTVARSGHTAILTGTYEDPITTILKDWTDEPVQIDSLITQSKRVWFWGSKDILSKFNPQNLPHVYVNTYSSNQENKWIVSKIKNFLTKNKYRINLKGSVFDDVGTLYLIHLPLSSYSRTKNLDNDIEAISEHFTKAFADKSTAFVVTSPFGLTDWGSHGGESNSETRTPFIAWGAGIKRSLRKLDMIQVDIAPLLACLMGVSIPVHSLGVVPLGYLNLPEEQFVSEQATNALQLGNLFEAHGHWIKAHSVLFFRYKQLDFTKLPDQFAHLKFLHLVSNYADLNRDCSQLIDEMLKGILYYQTYYNEYLVSCILTGYFLWIVYLVSRVFMMPRKASSGYKLSFGVIAFPIYLSHIHSWPLLYYIYSTFPFVMFYIACPYLQHSLSLMNNSNYYYCVGCIIMFVQMLLLSTYYRYIISLALLCIAASPLIQGFYGESFSNKGKMLWLSLCVVLSVLSAIPRLVPTTFSLSFLIYGFSIWTYFFLSWFRRLQLESESLPVFVVQTSCFVFVALDRIFLYFGASPRIFISWLLSAIPMVSIPFTNNAPLMRIAAVTFGASPFYFLTSSSGELIFLVVYVVTLLHWWIAETSSSQDLEDTTTEFRLDDQKEAVRRTFMVLIFLFTGFYGAGNIFSVSSYNPMWAQWFCPNFLIRALVTICKISTPMFICVFIYRAINVATKQNASQIICLLMVALDVITFEMLLMFVFNINSLTTINFAHLVTMTGFTLIILLSFILADVMSNVSFLHFIKRN